MSITSSSALLATCAVLGAGGVGAAILTTSAGASPVTPHALAKPHLGVGVHTGTGTVSVTGPAGRTHTRSVKVACRVQGGRYVVRTLGRRDRLRLSVAEYAGAGNYTGTAVITHHTASGFSRHHYSVPVTLSAAGGDATYSRTLSGKRDPALKGKTISANASWTCSV